VTKLTEFYAKALVLLTAVPTYGAVAVAVLTTVQLEVVPLLPADYGLQVGGRIATAVAIITALVKVVARVKPAAPAERGLLPPS
jgi:hypothetical protein